MLKKNIVEIMYLCENQKQITTSFVMNRFHNHMIFDVSAILSTSMSLCVKICEESKTLLYFQAIQLACHNFMVLAKGMGLLGLRERICYSQQ